MPDADISSGVTFDAGGLIALDRNDRRILLLIDWANRLDVPITVPATALAQAVRRPERRARLARLLGRSNTEVVALERVDATNVGHLLQASGTSDIADAHVVICARRARQAVVSSDRADLQRLDPTLRVIDV